MASRTSITLNSSPSAKTQASPSPSAPFGLEATVVNVGDTERVASTVAGGALTVLGLTRGSLSGLGLALAGGALLYRGLSGNCPTYGALGVSTAEPDAARGRQVTRSVTINASREQLYRFWRNLENLPQFMDHLAWVDSGSPTRSHWVAKAPLGLKVEWDAEIVEDRENELISWRSLPGSRVPNSGTVRFSEATGGRGTEVTVTLEYAPPGGEAGAAVAKLFGEEPDIQIREDLRRFKRLIEAGEIPTTTGQPKGG